LEPTTSDCAS